MTFYGNSSYYGELIKGFALLHALTEKLKPRKWTELCDKAFMQLNANKAYFSSHSLFSTVQHGVYCRL